MSELKAVGKLRQIGINRLTTTELGRIADEIEAEVERDYMRLPRDCEGEPIRPGDVVASDISEQKQVWMVSTDGFAVYGDCSGYNPKAFTHVKPRTLEDVLCDVWKEAIDYAKSDMWRSPDEVFTERADEIRAMCEKVDR